MQYSSKISIHFIGVLAITAPTEHLARLLNGGHLRTIVAKLQTFVGADVNAVTSKVQLSVPFPSEVEPPGPDRTYQIGVNFTLVGDLVLEALTEHDARESVATLETEILDEVALWPVTEMESLEVTATVHG